MRRAPLVLLAAIAALALPAEASAGTFSWDDALLPDGPTWHRPTADGLRVAPGPAAGYHLLSIFVDRTGVYEITSDQAVYADDPFDGFLALYAESFDAARPLRHLVAANDDGPAGPATSKIVVPLVAGVIYQVVTTVAGAPSTGQFFYQNSISGPGRVRESACFLDDPFRSDLGDELSLHDGRFCVSVTWVDFLGNRGAARPVGHRSNDSAVFWFFGEENWELLVKVIDGCAINHRFWVFLAGTTNVGFEVEVRDIQQGAEWSFSNPLRHPADAVTDTGALDACTFFDGLVAERSPAPVSP